MKHFTITFFLFFLLFINAFGQNEGWSSTCSPNLPSIAEVMIDAYGSNEFFSEYIILKVGEQPFNVRNLNFRVINPFNNAFIGSVKIEENSTNSLALTQLNSHINFSCLYNTVFRDVFAEPYNGIIPPHSAILIFNNKDSVDLSYLSNDAFNSLCGSKVFTAFGTIKTQSPGVSIFRNHPRNGSCGTTGCLRKLEFQFEGASAPYCSEITYDIKNLPHLNTSNPPDGYGDGSYIRPSNNGKINYGGGNLTGNGTPMPPLSMMCSSPPQPGFGSGIWNVSVFDGLNNFIDFKGYYQAKGNHIPVELLPTGSFEYNTIRDGWQPLDAPSEAHPTYGALSAYDGCNVKKDSFSTIARRKGFPCGNYNLQLANYTDFTRIKIDVEGDGTWEFDNSYNPPLCAVGCGVNIWNGYLYSDSKIEIWGYDDTNDFNIQLLFKKDTTSPSPLKFNYNIKPSSCNSSNGAISLSLSGGVSPYSIVWNTGGATPSNQLAINNLNSGVYTAYVSDSKNCKDSVRILVPQINTVIADAGNDTSFCSGGTAILRGYSNLTNNVLFEWLDEKGRLLSNQPIVSVTPPVPSYYFLKVSDGNGCFDIDTVFVNVRDIPFFTLKMTTKDTICNGINPTFIVSKGYSYKWTTFPADGTLALNSTTNDSISLFSQLLPATSYTIYVEGLDGNGCTNTLQKSFVIKPLPSATILPVKDTICSNAPPLQLIVSSNDKGRFYVENASGNVINNVINNSLFYPQKTEAGKFTVYYEVTNSFGCRINPAIEINVKSCCSKPDSTLIKRTTCHQSEVGIIEKHFLNTSLCDSIVIISTQLLIDTVFIKKTSCNPLKVGKTIAQKMGTSACDTIIVTETALTQGDLSFNLKITQPISCFGKNDGIIEINDIKGGTPHYKYQWNSGSTSSSLKNLSAGNYQVTLIDNDGCVKMDSILLPAPPPLSIDAEGIQARCLGDEKGSIVIKNYLGGTPPLQIFIDGNNTPTSNPTVFINNITQGYHNLVLKDKNNCSIDTSVQVKDGRELLVDLGTDITLDWGDSITLNPISNFPLVKAQWSKNTSIQCDTCLSITVRPQYTSNFRLLVKDSLGCQASDNITISVNKKQLVFIPNSFSPDDDGINDILMIYSGETVRIIKAFQIYDRWGSLIFQNTNFSPNSLSSGWDGTFNGKKLSAGVFVYYAEIEFIDGKKEIYQGDINLMR